MLTLALTLLLTAPPPAVAALTRGTLRLVGRFSGGHACVISPRLALTNGHIVDPRPFDKDVPLLPYTYSDDDGGEGVVVPIPGRLEQSRDLAAMEPMNEADEFKHYLPVAKERPKPGDRVWILGYDWSNKKTALADDPIEAKVTRVVALHINFYPSGQGGSSGSCVVNEAGEVVGINEGAWPTDDGEAGTAVGVWGVYKDKLQ